MNLTPDNTRVSLISARNRETRLIADRMAALREAGKPLTGPYYWVPTPYGWDISGFPEQGYGEVEHPQIWRSSIVPKLVDLWHLTDLEAMDLVRCPYGVPRGRVAKGHDTGHTYILQGDDAPYPQEEAISKVAREMSLEGLLANNLLNIEFEQHETMNVSQQETVNRILSEAKQRSNKGE